MSSFNENTALGLIKRSCTEFVWYLFVCFHLVSTLHEGLLPCGPFLRYMLACILEVLFNALLRCDILLSTIRIIICLFFVSTF